jgi:hypothetical protein
LSIPNSLQDLRQGLSDEFAEFHWGRECRIDCFQPGHGGQTQLNEPLHAGEGANVGVFDGILADVSRDDVATRLRDCDHLFLAADTATARLVFNAIAHQFLIPGVQAGSKVPVDDDSGEVGDVFSVVRPVIPDSGCLWCAKLINPTRLAEEAQSPEERERHRYVDEVPAPSVITLNAMGAGHAANEFLFSLTGLREPGWHERYFRYHPRACEVSMDSPLCDPECMECGLGPGTRRARGRCRASYADGQAMSASVPGGSLLR